MFKNVGRRIYGLLVVVRTGFEPVIVDMVSTVDYPPHLTTYPCVYQFRHLTICYYTLCVNSSIVGVNLYAASFIIET
jgi:hypothetical protein